MAAVELWSWPTLLDSSGIPGFHGLVATCHTNSPTHRYYCYHTSPITVPYHTSTGTYCNMVGIAIPLRASIPTTYPPVPVPGVLYRYREAQSTRPVVTPHKEWTCVVCQSNSLRSSDREPLARRERLGRNEGNLATQNNFQNKTITERLTLTMER